METGLLTTSKGRAISLSEYRWVVFKRPGAGYGIDREPERRYIVA